MSGVGAAGILGGVVEGGTGGTVREEVVDGMFGGVTSGACTVGISGGVVEGAGGVDCAGGVGFVPRLVCILMVLSIKFSVSCFMVPRRSC